MKRWLRAAYHRFIIWGDVNRKICNLYVKMNRAYLGGHKLVSDIYCHKIEKKYQCRITPGAKIGKHLTIPHPNGIVVGKGREIGDNVTIYHQVTIGQNHGKYPVIGNNVIIYAGAKIVGGIRVGDNCIVGANAVVIDDVPENNILGGVPAK